MTLQPHFSDLADIVADLSRSMPPEMRFQRLLDVLARNFPCDAIALLAREGGVLVPKAIKGLSPDTLGRRFVIGSHPRLSQILDSRVPVRFAADSELPDPYDGLIENSRDHLYVHDCMGASLYFNDIPWGVVTMDSLNPGAFDEIDLDVLEAFLHVTAATVHVADWIQHLEAQLDRRQKILSTHAVCNTPSQIIAESDAMIQLMKEVKTVANSDLPVLILGETGVGKEIVANAIHSLSARSDEPMVYVNCAALPEAVAESELFGHVKGAFTGAADHRAGKFELAHEGTIFLDEVGELPLSLQPKLLRTLQNGEIQRIGSDENHKVDVRLVAATNRDLKKEVAEGRFRADLYHRLSVYPMVVPALRDRPADILPLAGFFLERDSRRIGARGVSLSSKAKSWLQKLEWPGNIRELEHTLSRGVIRAISEGQDPEKVIELDVQQLGLTRPTTSDGLAPEASAETLDDLPLKDILDDYKRQIIRSRLSHHNGNKAATARSLGIDRGNFVRMLKTLGM
jgi:anaerobic nitric oxide reductase transcription regulator